MSMSCFELKPAVFFAWFYGGGEEDPEIEVWSDLFATRVPDGRVCMAAIQEHLLRYRTDPESAVLALDEEPIEGADQRETSGAILVA